MAYQYVFGTHKEGDRERRIVRVKGQEPPDLPFGLYLTASEASADMIVTHDFMLDECIKREADAEGHHYAWYNVAEYSRTIDRSPGINTAIGQNAEVSSIAFVTMAEKGDIDGETAGEHADLFAEWAWPVAYVVGQLRVDPENKALYRCIQAHTSQEDWPPRNTPALWARAADPAEEWPEWSQPVGAADAYALGAKVSHNGKHWISTCDSNVWEPGVYGGDEQE